MTAIEAIKLCFINMLNASLRFQGFGDTTAVGLSDDYQIVMLKRVHHGRVTFGAVHAELLLPDIKGEIQCKA